MKNQNRRMKEKRQTTWKCISGEDLLGEDVSEAYKILYLNWKEECISGEKQKAKINVLLQYKTNLITRITYLKE